MYITRVITHVRVSFGNNVKGGKWYEKKGVCVCVGGGDGDVEVAIGGILPLENF